MKFVALVQARLNSIRLPGKVLKTILDQPLLFYTLTRLQKCKTSFQIVVATTTHSQDDRIVNFCHQMQIATFRGSENNVLERFYQASKQYPADAYIRITGDCPLIDYKLLDQMLEYFSHNSQLDYLSNTLVRTYPKGLDVEIFKKSTLINTYHSTIDPYDCEHVTPYIYKHPEKFYQKNFADLDNFSDINLSVDTIEDYAFVKSIIEKLSAKDPFFCLDQLKAYFKEQ